MDAATARISANGQVTILIDTSRQTATKRSEMFRHIAGEAYGCQSGSTRLPDSWRCWCDDAVLHAIAVWRRWVGVEREKVEKMSM